ncbi:MAG: 50S ribosomal protein L6 [Planctomycetota bacterium]|jgi:large subunit ribosomal protein L6
MSRIGKKPISVPGGVKVDVQSGTRTVQVEGPKGKLSFQWRPEVDVVWDEGSRQIECRPAAGHDGDRLARALWGTTRARIQNMILGVTTGFSRRLEVIGVGWNAKVKGKSLELNVGYCHPIVLDPPAGVEFAVEQNAITITGADKQAVGQFAAVVRDKRRPEPYKGKGIRYSDEFVIRKQGKVFGK